MKNEVLPANDPRSGVHFLHVLVDNLNRVPKPIDVCQVAAGIGTEVVKDGDLGPFSAEALGDIASDESQSAGHRDVLSFPAKTHPCTNLSTPSQIKSSWSSVRVNEHGKLIPRAETS